MSAGNDGDDGGESNGDPPDLVICFDRDSTVSVRPSTREGHRAVPLAWLKYLAHDERAANVDVWATGNQRLREEAMIPGVAEAVACWKHRFLGSPTAKSGDGGYDRMDTDPPRPRRRDRLRIVADLYRDEASDGGGGDDGDGATDDPAFAVVDDVSMKDLHREGIEHFLPWVFCALVEDTDGRPEILDDVGVSLPLDELPAPVEPADRRGAEGEGAVRDSADGGDTGDGFAYTNEPEREGESEFGRTWYDPTLPESGGNEAAAPNRE